MREAFEVLQMQQVLGESATPGPQQQVPATPLQAMLGRVNGLELKTTPKLEKYQVRNDSKVAAASECVNGGVVRAILESNMADGSASARIRVRGVAK